MNEKQSEATQGDEFGSVGSPAWCKALDNIGYAFGFHEPISKCVDNEKEFAPGTTPAEAFQEGWLDYMEDDGK